MVIQWNCDPFIVFDGNTCAITETYNKFFIVCVCQVIETTGAKKSREDLANSAVIVDYGNGSTGYGTYSNKNKKSKEWSKEGMRLPCFPLYYNLYFLHIHHFFNVIYYQF